MALALKSHPVVLRPIEPEPDRRPGAPSRAFSLSRLDVLSRSAHVESDSQRHIGNHCSSELLNNCNTVSHHSLAHDEALAGAIG